MKYVVDKNDKLVAFAVTMPSFSRALQKANGKLFPFGIFHLLKAKKRSKDVLFYLIGVHPDYQNKGVHAILFNECYETFNKLGVEYCIRTPELADNIAVQQIWKRFDPVLCKRRRTYRKNL
jgi:GNAT superfamily N-acetyltransferase